MKSIGLLIHLKVNMCLSAFLNQGLNYTLVRKLSCEAKGGGNKLPLYFYRWFLPNLEGITLAGGYGEVCITDDAIASYLYILGRCHMVILSHISSRTQKSWRSAKRYRHQPDTWCSEFTITNNVSFNYDF